MEAFANIALGLETALSPTNLLYCFVGVFLGTFIGVIPGVGTLAAMSMLFPLTFHLDPTTALIMLAGIWYGTSYGGNTASILLNIPGTPANAVTCLDGYPMARQGRGGVALFMTTIASFVGGSIGIILLMLFAPVIATYALNFRSPEYFAIMLLGLVAASTISEGSAVKGLSMMVVGLMLGTVGADIYSGVQRFTFGSPNLIDGINLVALAMGLFGVAEIIGSIGKIKVGDIDPESVKFKAMRPTRDDWRRSVAPMLRGSSIGAFFGALPGIGTAVAAFISYAVEKKVAREPERFGKGAIEGIMAPESSNNSADQTSFIPTLSLGIPGSPPMALMLGIMMVHGIAPGPGLVTDQAQLFWGLVMSFWIGNLLLLVLNIPLIGLWIRLLLIPYHLLYPAILVFICIGTYTLTNSPFDVWSILVFGAIGYLMRIMEWPAAPLLLGFVLGPLLEEHFRRTLLLSRGNFMVFAERPITAIVLLFTGILLVWTLITAAKNMRRLRVTKAGWPI